MVTRADSPPVYKPVPAKPQWRLPRWSVLALCLWGISVRGVPLTPASHPLVQACELHPTAACWTALEVRALHQHPGQARREGGSLWLTPSPGGEPLRWDDGEKEGLHHVYLGGLTGTDLHLVCEQADGQPERYRLVGPGTASLQPLTAPPWPAPGGRLLAVPTRASATQPGSLTVLNRVGSQWRLLYHFEPVARLGFEFRGWRSDAAALHLEWRCVSNGATGVTQLRDGPYGWDLVPAPPTHCP